MRVVVVGVGVMGAAAGWALARRGHDVVFTEQFHVGHTRGSSHGTARYRQLAAYPTDEYLELGLRARRLWDDVEKGSPENILHRTSNISIGDADILERQAATLRKYGADGELISGSEVTRMWPALSLPQHGPVLLQSDGEVIAANRALHAFVGAAEKAGAQLIENCRVTSVEETSTGAVVRTDDDVISADHVVVTGGPWAKPLAAEIGLDLPLTVTRQTVAYFDLPGFVPPTITDFGGNEPYALWDPVHGLKAAEHRAGPETDPDTTGRPDKSTVQRVTEWVGRLFSTVVPSPHRVETCLYTNAPGDRIIIERRGRIVVASPCSGQGFQFSPAIGERLADLVCE
jgi:monomeric sarcosine oxidase